MMHGNDHPFPDDSSHRHGPDIPSGILRVAAIFALALLFASGLPPALVPPVMAQLLTIAAVVSTGIAASLREHPLAAEMTRWDEAAMLGVLALSLGFLTDHDAAKNALETIAPLAGFDGALR